MMWHHCIEDISDTIHRYAISRGDASLTYREVIDSWISDAAFRSFHIGLLMESRFAAYRWETPIVTANSIDRDFEFVLLNCESLERPADPSAFSDLYDDSSVVTTANLSGDATLVVPCPVDEQSSYAHLAAFIRTAPESQMQQLWQAVGIAVFERVSGRPLWLSTAGMGVAWLHVRLDSRPKYYAYAPYRSVTTGASG